MLAYLIGTPFKKNIRYLRRKRRISQKEMAKKMEKKDMNTIIQTVNYGE